MCSAAQFRQGECSPDMRLEYAQTSMGLLHLHMAVVKLVLNTHMGKPSDVWSLERWIKELERDGNKIRSTFVKDHNAYVDFLDTILDGCILATLCRSLFPTSKTTDIFAKNIGTKSLEDIDTAIKRLQSLMTDYSIVSYWRQLPVMSRNIYFENMLLFMQQALILRNFQQAIRQGDSGRVVHCLAYFTVWFQDTRNYNYAAETMRLMACLRRIWSDDLRKYWMETCLLTTTGKEQSFMSLDEFNEYIVREVKEMIANNVTPATDNHLRNTLSLLITILRDVRRKVAEETDSHIFDFHSTKVDNWRDTKVIADYIFQAGFLPGDWQYKGGAKSPSSAKDLFADGQSKLAMTQPIEKLKKAFLDGEFDIEEGEEEIEVAEMKSDAVFR